LKKFDWKKSNIPKEFLLPPDSISERQFDKVNNWEYLFHVNERVGNHRHATVGIIKTRVLRRLC